MHEYFKKLNYSVCMWLLTFKRSTQNKHWIENKVVVHEITNRKYLKSKYRVVVDISNFYTICK